MINSHQYILCRDMCLYVRVRIHVYSCIMAVCLWLSLLVVKFFLSLVQLFGAALGFTPRISLYFLNLRCSQ